MNEFNLRQEFLEAYRHRTPDWGPLGYIVYKRTYARPGEEWPDTCQRVIEGMYSIMRRHCYDNGISWNDDKAMRSAEEAFDRMFDFKWLPPGRGIANMGLPVVDARGGAVLNNCFAHDTEFITADGIKKLGDVADTNQVVLTQTGEWVEAPIKCFGEQPLMKLVVSRQGITKEIYATPDHAWFVGKTKSSKKTPIVKVTTKELVPGVHQIPYVFGKSALTLTTPSPVGIAHGFTYGDGSTIHGDNNANCVHLFGQKDSALEPYFYGCPRSAASGHTAGIRFGALPNFFRELPSLSENKAYLLGWLVGYFAADGSMSGSAAKISSTDLNSIRFVRSVCAVLGIGTYSILAEDRISNLTNKPSRIYNINLMTNHLTEDFFLIEGHKEVFRSINKEKMLSRWNVVSIESTDRVEPVYCATVEGHGNFALADNLLTGNCGFVSTKNKTLSDAAAWTMDMLMLGVGVGSDVAGAGALVYSPPIAQAEVSFDDTREGWVEALHYTLSCFEGKGSLAHTFDFSNMRPKGAPLVTMGGVSSGAGPLIELLANVIGILSNGMYETTIEDTRLLVKCNFRFDPYELTSTHIADVINVIGKCVVSGGVRRSSEILLGDMNDDAFLNLKNDTDKLSAWRWASNNSMIADDVVDVDKFMPSIIARGEPGFFWLENARAYSRMGDPFDSKDHGAVGTNPCSEQTLWDQELCTLVETFPARHVNKYDYWRTLKYAYLYAKVVTLVPIHDPATDAIVKKNRRIGTSMSGVQQAIAKFGRERFFNWFADAGYTVIRTWDNIYSEWLKVNRSIKVTSVKPSGTISLLPGATPGMHFDHAPFYIRRVRIEDTSPLIPLLEKAGYPIEKDASANNTFVVEIPVAATAGSKTKKDASVSDQHRDLVALQRMWADNQVSVTITFDPNKPEDVDTVRNIILTGWEKLKSVSFLPEIPGGAYKQMPYEEITEEEYIRRVDDIVPVEYFATSAHATDEKFCDTDHCVL